MRGIFEEGSYGTNGGDMDTLKDYVMGRMLWNVTLDPDAVITEFLAGYFGPAAPYVRLYLDTFHGAIADTNYYMHESVPTDAPFLTPMALLTGGQAFAEALVDLKKTPGSAYTARVDTAKIAVYYVVLLRWDEIQSFAKKESIAWPWEPTKEAAMAEFNRVWDVLKIVSTKEGSCNYTCYKAQVFPNGTDAASAAVAPMPVHRHTAAAAVPPMLV